MDTTLTQLLQEVVDLHLVAKRLREENASLKKANELMDAKLRGGDNLPKKNRETADKDSGREE